MLPNTPIVIVSADTSPGARERALAAGAVGFIYAGWHEALLPSGAVGFVYFPAFLGISTTSLIFARLGATLAHRLPADTLKKLFACLLLLVGITFIVGH